MSLGSAKKLYFRDFLSFELEIWSWITLDSFQIQKRLYTRWKANLVGFQPIYGYVHFFHNFTDFFAHIGYKSGFFSQILTLWRHSNHSFRDTRNYFIPIESPWNSIQPTFDVHSAADNTFLAKWQIMVKPPKTPFTPIFDLAPVWGPPPTIFKKTFFFF